MCCNRQGEHTPLGSWSGDCRGAPMQPSGRSRGLLRTLSWSQGLVLPWPGPGRRALAALLRVLMSAAQFIAAQPFFLPWNRLPCFPAASHRVGGWGASCQAGFGSLGLWVCGVCSCGFCAAHGVGGGFGDGHELSLSKLAARPCHPNSGWQSLCLQHPRE